MVIGDRLRALCEQKGLSQRDIQKLTSLHCYYVSRIENGHTVPSVQNLEKLARALGVPLYQLFYEGEEVPELPTDKKSGGIAWGSSGKELRLLSKFRRLLARMGEGDRLLLLYVARGMARRK